MNTHSTEAPSLTVCLCLLSHYVLLHLLFPPKFPSLKSYGMEFGSPKSLADTPVFNGLHQDPDGFCSDFPASQLFIAQPVSTLFSLQGSHCTFN